MRACVWMGGGHYTRKHTKICSWRTHSCAGEEWGILHVFCVYVFSMITIEFSDWIDLSLSDASHTHELTRTHTHTHTLSLSHTHTHTHTRTHTHAHTHTHTHTHTQTHTHTHTIKRNPLSLPVPSKCSKSWRRWLSRCGEGVLQRVAVWYSVLQYVAMCFRVQ